MNFGMACSGVAAYIVTIDQEELEVSFMVRLAGLAGSREATAIKFDIKVEAAF